MSAAAKQALPERSVLAKRLVHVALTTLPIVVVIAFAKRLMSGEADLGLAATMPLLLAIYPGHARMRFASVDATEWLLAIGVWTRRRLALWFLVDEACRAGVAVAAVAALHQLDLFASDTKGFQMWCVALTLRALCMLALHVPGCAWLPSWMRSLRWRFRAFGLRDVAALSKGVAFVLLIAAPLVALVLWARSPWPLVPCAFVLTLITSACIASSEPVSALAYPESKGQPREGTAFWPPSFSPHTALLWLALDAKGLLFFACLAAPVIISAVVSLSHASDTARTAAFSGVAFISTAIVLFLPQYGVWRWKSAGPTAEYLASVGVTYGKLRRAELLLGVMAALFPVAWVVVLDIDGPPKIPIFSVGLAAFSVALAGVPLLACNRSFVDARANPSHRANELIMGWLAIRCSVYFACLWLLRRMNASHQALLVFVVSCLAIELATFAFAVWRWIVAWLQTRDENWLRQSEIEGLQAANETRARAAEAAQ